MHCHETKPVYDVTEGTDTLRLPRCSLLPHEIILKSSFLPLFNMWQVQQCATSSWRLSMRYCVDEIHAWGCIKCALIWKMTKGYFGNGRTVAIPWPDILSVSRPLHLSNSACRHNSPPRVRAKVVQMATATFIFFKFIIYLFFSVFLSFFFFNLAGWKINK